jgi:hypothetical protein
MMLEKEVLAKKTVATNASETAFLNMTGIGLAGISVEVLATARIWILQSITVTPKVQKMLMNCGELLHFTKKPILKKHLRDLRYALTISGLPTSNKVRINMGLLSCIFLVE